MVQTLSYTYTHFIFTWDHSHWNCLVFSSWQIVSHFQVFRKGRQFEYKGRRDQEGIVEYMKEQIKLPSREVTTVLEATNNFARTDANIIGYFPEKNDMFEEYVAAANELRGEEAVFTC